MIQLDGKNLTLESIRRIVLENEKAAAAPEAMKKVKMSRGTVEQIIDRGEVVYGVNTGFGKLSDVTINSGNLSDLQRNLIYSHACGVGDPLPEKIVKTICLLRANALLKGFSGVRPIVIDRLLDFVNIGIFPIIPEQGSLGASGDLAPLSHLALALIGEGTVIYQGRRMPAKEALTQEQLEPLELSAKEGLALINGTQVMTAIGVIAYLEGEELAYQSEIIASLTMEGLRGIIDAFDERIHAVRGYPEQMEVARRIRNYLEDSKLVTKQGELRVQDAYSIRCIPQIHGASWQALNYVKEKLEIEINAATDNPLIFSEEGDVLSGGNFHGQPIALAMDFLKIAVSELANVSERRTERLVNPQLNDLPPFLSSEPGLQSGAMILQYTAASLVSENKTLAHPASVDSIPSSANQEDHVSMGTIAARHAYQIIQNVRNVLAIECICALQAAEYRGIDKMAGKTRNFYFSARKIVPSIDQDRMFSIDIKNMSRFLQTNPTAKMNE